MTKLNDSTFITGLGIVIQNDSVIVSNDIDEISNKYHIVYDKNKDLWVKKNNNLYLLKDQGNFNFSIAQN